MKKIAAILAVICALAGIAYGGAVWYFSGVVVLSYKRPLEEDRQNLKIHSPADFLLPAPLDVRVPTDAGHIAGWLFRHPSAKKCAVILHHGHTGTRFGGLKYAPLFYTRGCAVLSVDGRYHGESSGDYCTYGYYDRHDMVRVVEWIKKELNLKNDQIGMLGESMGAVVSLMTAAETDLAFVAADSPYRDLDSILREQAVLQYGKPVQILFRGLVPVVEWRAKFKMDEVSALKAVSKIDEPVFLLHSKQDDYTNARHSEDIFAAIPHNRKVLHLTDWGAKHGRSINVNYADYKKLMDEFLKRYTRFP
jgi:dipeptidyl aminopeptidase/acylaminoacyl peptidase